MQGSTPDLPFAPATKRARRLPFAGLLCAFTVFALVVSWKAARASKPSVPPHGDFMGDYMLRYAPVLAALPPGAPVCWFCDVELGFSEDWIEGVFESFRAQYVLHPHRIVRWGDEGWHAMEWYVGSVHDTPKALSALQQLPVELVVDGGQGVLLLRRRKT